MDLLQQPHGTRNWDFSVLERWINRNVFNAPKVLFLPNWTFYSLSLSLSLSLSPFSLLKASFFSCNFSPSRGWCDADSRWTDNVGAKMRLQRKRSKKRSKKDLKIKSKSVMKEVKSVLKRSKLWASRNLKTHGKFKV